MRYILFCEEEIIHVQAGKREQYPVDKPSQVISQHAKAGLQGRISTDLDWGSFFESLCCNTHCKLLQRPTANRKVPDPGESNQQFKVD